MDYSKGDNLRLSEMTTTLHIGAHADSSSHYHVDGEGVEARDLNLYFGRCQVIQVKIERGERITELPVAVEAPRVLLKTDSFPDPDNWNEDFNSLAPSLVATLAEKGVKMIGIDTPSVDPFDCKDLLSHQIFFRHQMGILEGLVLKDVDQGFYQLVALPLRLKGADASPVRAVLYKD